METGTGVAIRLKWDKSNYLLVKSNEMHAYLNGVNNFSFFTDKMVATKPIDGRDGFVNIGKKSAFSWSGTIPVNASVNISHNLGYKPIVHFDGTVGNVVLTTSDASTTYMRIYAYGNPWTGTVYLW